MSRGRPKGYSPYIEISYEELGDYVGRKSLVKVGKVWLESLVSQTTAYSNVLQEPKAPKEEPKIEYQLTNFDED